MSPHATCHSASPIASLLEQFSDHIAGDVNQPRWGLIRRARRDIEAGLHDDQAFNEARLEVCIDEILADILP